jgi:hypothetical protein
LQFVSPDTPALTWSEGGAGFGPIVSIGVPEQEPAGIVVVDNVVVDDSAVLVVADVVVSVVVVVEVVGIVVVTAETVRIALALARLFTHA